MSSSSADSSSSTDSSPAAMVAFCAAHCVNLDQHTRTRDMIHSWQGQNEFTIPLHLSASGDPFHGKEQLTERLARGGKILVVRERGESLSQFEHYALLAEELAATATNDPWIMFTNFDGLWHPDRLREAMRLCFMARDHERPVHALAWSRHAAAVSGALTAPELASDVDKMIAEGTAKVVSCGESGAVEEHWARCVRLSTLREFTLKGSRELLRNPFADLFFLNWVDTKPDGLVASFDSDLNPGWSYYSYGDSRAVSLNWLSSEAILETVHDLPPAVRMAVMSVMHTVFILGVRGQDKVDRKALESFMVGLASAREIVNMFRPVYAIVDEIFRDDYFTRLGCWDVSVCLADA